ncbi:MAG: TIGR03013 family PEP-CTERM/XrtA system glycosyltransferase [Acidobacteria bacterium]|nr:TIGR03013 family PEP-CTERM/XrtA system glycosyltransferase [Acidobacteriota bacterium]
MRAELGILLILTTGLSGMTAAAYWFVTGNRDLNFVLLAEASLVVPAVLVGWRVMAARFGIPGFAPENLLILGGGPLALEVASQTKTQLVADHIVRGFVAPAEGEIAPRLSLHAPVYRGYDNLENLSPREVHRVVLAFQEQRRAVPVESLLKLRLKGITVESASSFIERTSGKIPVEYVRPSELYMSEGFAQSPARGVLKRLFDVAAASALFVLTLPLMALFAVLVRLDSPGPALYRQKRVGQDGRAFMIIKFRSMVQDAEKHSGAVWAQRDDPRITRIGRFMRKTRIDELPQLINVIRGEMSFVGPRPERPVFVEQLSKSIPYYALREVARPGLTGWAQVEYAYGASEEDALEKLKYDLFYIKHASLFLDLWIIAKTVKVCLLNRGR